jgi:pimeloyl-ACP methyl ester carboxylesterase
MSTSTGGDGLPPPSEDSPGAAKACSGGSPYFDDAAVRALVERDVARSRNVASSLTNHNAIRFDGPTRGGFGDIDVPTLVVHGDHDPVLHLPRGIALHERFPARSC